MNNNVNFRSFKEGDYETCVKWWKWWWKRTGMPPAKRCFLPSDKRCFVIEKNGIPVACYFLYLAKDPFIVGYTTYLVSNPKYKEKDRKDLIKLLINKVTEEAEKIGLFALWTVSGDKFLSTIHKDLNWMMIHEDHLFIKFLSKNFTGSNQVSTKDLIRLQNEGNIE